MNNKEALELKKLNDDEIIDIISKALKITFHNIGKQKRASLKDGDTYEYISPKNNIYRINSYRTEKETLLNCEKRYKRGRGSILCESCMCENIYEAVSFFEEFLEYDTTLYVNTKDSKDIVDIYQITKRYFEKNGCDGFEKYQNNNFNGEYVFLRRIER